MRIVQHREIPDDPGLQRQWNDLVLGMPEVFYTCEWAQAVQTAYRDSIQPLLFLGYEGDELVGVASLAADPADGRVGFLGATTADYCDFLSLPHLRPAFVHAVFAELARMKVRSVKLANLPEDSATVAALGIAARRHGFHAYMRPAYLCAQVQLGAGEERKQLKVALTGKKKLRQYLRGMEREGPVTFAHLRSPAEIEAALPEFADAHVARFQAVHRISSLSTRERRMFLQQLAQRFGDSGVVTLSVLRVGNRPVAWNYGFRFRGSWFWYQPTFDSSHEANSPGHCLLSRIIIEACDLDEIKVVDLGLGAEGYKERFGNCTRQTLYVTATNSRRRHLQEVIRYRAASLLKKSPKVENLVRRLLRQRPSAPDSAPRAQKHLD